MKFCPSEPGERGAWSLGTTFTIERPAIRARLYATAHGLYEAFLDGNRIGDLELTPGWTSYSARQQVQTFDVTQQIKHGLNQLDIIVSDGWFRGVVGFARTPNAFGDQTSVLAKLVIEHDDASLTLVATDGSWTFRATQLIRADLLGGQTTDFTRAIESGFGSPVVELPWPVTKPLMVNSPAPPVRQIETILPMSVEALEPGVHLVDMGQNISGWVRLKNLGPIGTVLTIEHGEALSPDTGYLTTDHLRPTDMKTFQPLPAGQIDRVVSSGKTGEVFEPRHSTKGFRYAQILGHPGPLRIDDIEGVVVHSDLERRGWFDCSDTRLNQLHEVAVWSLRGNMCDIPTDCPQRERVGWTGDWQLFAPTAAFLYDVGGFSVKWLADLAVDQRADGSVPWFVPNPIPAEETLAGLAPHGCAGWGDAAVIVPWEVYLATGDLGLLADQYESAKAWVNFALNQAETGRGRQRAEQHPEPALHEQYLWDSGFHFGEWLEPGEWNANPIAKAIRTDPGPTATAYLSRSSGLLSRIAALLGKTDDSSFYASASLLSKAAWQTEFISPSGEVTPLNQANLVRGLHFGLIPSEHIDRCVSDLVQLIRDADTHLGTGFLSTPLLLPVLADHGHLELAFELLYQDSSPSWLAMLKRGATTVWEDWDGIDERGVASASLNHYSKGAVISFLHRYVGGLRLDESGYHPAYSRFTVRPIVGGVITTASVRHESSYGTIEVAWNLADSVFVIDVTVPPGTQADLVLPDGSSETIFVGSHHRSVSILPAHVV